MVRPKGVSIDEVVRTYLTRFVTYLHVTRRLNSLWNMVTFGFISVAIITQRK